LLVGRLLVALLLLQRIFLAFFVAKYCSLLLLLLLYLFFFAQYLLIPDAWKTNYEGVIAVRVIGGAVPPNSDKLSRDSVIKHGRYAV